MILAVYDHPVIVPAAVALVLGVPAFYGLWRSRDKDKAAQELAADSERTAHVTEAREGLESIIRWLQADNKALREQQVRQDQRIERQERRIERLEREIRELRANGKGK